MTTTSRLLLLIPLLVVTVILLPKACAQHRSSTTWDLLLPLANSIPLDSATEYIPQVHPKRHLLWNIVSICSSTSWELLLPRSNNISFDTTEYIPKLDSKHRLLWHVVSMCNSTTWELLLSLANNIGLDIRESDSKRYLLWNTYRTSSTSERLAIVKEFNEELTRWEYINSRINMIGLFLFGPEKYQSTLSTVRGKKPIVDDWKCFKSTLELFEKHCCLLPELGSRHIRAFTNICNYVAEKAAIKEAIIVSCAMTKTEIYGIDVRNPSVQATPAPVSGSPDNYCARIFVNGTTSRWNLGSYARPYRVLLAVSRAVRHRLHDKVQICFHRDASLGLCECGNDEWRSLQNGTWSAVMSPYMTYYIDVKYTSRIYDSVNVTLDQVSQEWRYLLLVVGFFLLLLAPVVCKWVMRVIALTCIFESSIDTPLAIVAVVTCLGLYIVMRSIKGLVLSNLRRCSGQETTIVERVKITTDERVTKITGYGISERNSFPTCSIMVCETKKKRRKNRANKR